MLSSWRKISQEEANDQSMQHVQEVDAAHQEHLEHHVTIPTCQQAPDALSTHPCAVESRVHRRKIRQRAQLVAQIAQAKAQEVQPSQCSSISLLCPCSMFDVLQLLLLLAACYSPTYNVSAEIVHKLMDGEAYTSIDADSIVNEPEEKGNAECCSCNCLHKMKVGKLDRNFCLMCKNSSFVCEKVGDCTKEFALHKQKELKYLSAIELNPSTCDTLKVPPPPCAHCDLAQWLAGWCWLARAVAAAVHLGLAVTCMLVW